MSYSEEELIEELQRVSEEYCDGETPRNKDMKKYGVFSNTVYYNRFGSWNEALQEAGFQLNMERNVPREKLIEELERISNEKIDGKTPNREKIIEHSTYSLSIYTEHFNSWNEALQEAGLEPIRWYGIGEDEFIKDIRRVSNSLEKPPTIDEYQKYGKYGASTITKEFEGWNRALKECGLDPNQRKDIPDCELLEEIERVSEEYCHGDTPRQKDMNKYGEYSASVYLDRFGSWNECLKYGGYEVNVKTEISKGEIISNVNEISTRYCDEKTPTQEDMHNHGEYSLSTAVRRFGSWNNLIEECGLEPNNNSYTKKELEEELKSISKKYCDGDTPTITEFREKSDIHSKPYINRWGGWNNALEKCGFSPNYEKYTKKKIKKEIKRISEKYYNGETPTISELTHYASFSAPTIKSHFESYNHLLKEVGFEANRITYISEEELLQEIERVAEVSEYSSPSQADMIQYGEYSIYPYYSKFGSWVNAKKEIDLSRVRNVGEENPNWKGGHDNYYGQSWYPSRESAWRRDEYTCRVCCNTDEQRNSDVHHITPVRYWNVEKEHEKMNHLRNLICLCRSCHHKLEGKFKGRNHKEFEELAKDYLDIEEVEEKKGIFDY